MSADLIALAEKCGAQQCGETGEFLGFPSPESLEAFAAALSSKEAGPSEEQPSEIWAVIDDMGQPCHSATWPETCHEHINDAIADGIGEASTWVVRRYTLAATQATQGVKP